MKKKLTVIVCVVLVALFAFAACGAPAAESSTSSAPAEESKAPAEYSDSGTAESGEPASSDGTVKAVSYTHLDVYKRQRAAKKAI